MNRKGFTLIELLVVVLIIGILAAVALPQYMKAVEKSRATEVITLFNALTKAEAIYKLSEGVFTRKLRELDVQFPKVSAAASGYFETKNFDVEVINPTGDYSSAKDSSFLVRATREASPIYYIYASIDDNGVITTWCGVDDNQTEPTELTGTDEATALCRNISNGNRSENNKYMGVIE